MTGSNLEIEDSPLGHSMTRDGVTVDVCIYRFRHSDDGWVLEVVDLSGDSTVSHKRFSTDRDAYADFKRALSTGEIRSLLEKPPGQSLH